MDLGAQTPDETPRPVIRVYRKGIQRWLRQDVSELQGKYLQVHSTWEYQYPHKVAATESRNPLNCQLATQFSLITPHDTATSTMSGSNTQNDQAGAAVSAALNRLQGTDNQEKTIDPKDRRALNGALSDQTTIRIMQTQGIVSKRARLYSKAPYMSLGRIDHNV
ncbi:MAG: hypothetical protein M1834_003337 [Cirrosporium novae-zelandiae]|nr:MAG: hypothetical protein M1834_003337 [Cirrosporium novae-zelandiae]